MRTLRAMLVVLTALSLALLPVAGSAAHLSSTPSVSAHADCCTPGQDCGEHSKGDCTKDAFCAFACASVSAVPLASSEMASSANSSAELTPVLQLNLSLAPNPPSPPPRT
jgi:hypothetical protein